MKLKKSIFCCIAFIAVFGNVYAKNKVVSYRCPTIKEADDMDIRTTINDKDVHWRVESNNYRRDDKPSKFMGVVLKKQTDDSYDMSIQCIYMSENNNKYVLVPQKSFHWYVDGVAEKSIGSNWSMDSKGRFMCSSSINNCKFYFR